MDDKIKIQKRLETIRERKPSYCGIIFRSIIGKSGAENNFAEFGGIIRPKTARSRLTADDIINAVSRYEIDSHEAIILLQYRRCTGMVLKYCRSDRGSSLYLIGELEPREDHFDLMI